jgi:hypothetical protein
MYKLSKPHKIFGESNSVNRLSDGASIPFDPANTDYQEFLRWCEAGNEPLPPDSQE